MLLAMMCQQTAYQQATVYIVDHDEAVRDSICTLLSPLNVSVKSYACAEDLLSDGIVTTHCCLITELYLPGMSGLELLDVLRLENKPIPTIVLASYSDVPTAVRTMRAGAIDFIDKPIIDRLLIERVRQTLRKQF